MSFNIEESKTVNLVDSSGKVVGTSLVKVTLTLKVTTVVVSESSTTAHVYSTSSTVVEGELQGNDIWEFFGYYDVTLDPNSSDSVLLQAESQVKYSINLTI